MKTAFDEPLNGELLSMASTRDDFDPNTRLPVQQVKTGYTTAIAVQKPRELAIVHKRLMAEAKLAGESFYYGWGNGKDRIEGPSVGLAMAAVRCFGNAAVDTLPIQELDDSWVVTTVFIDLETGFTLTRPFRQSKKWVIYGKMDAERKDDVRFQIGASKSARNVVLNALPQWLIDAAVVEAKQGVREKIQAYVDKNGIAAAVELVTKGLAKHGVKEVFVLEKCAVPELKGLTIDHVVMLRGDLHALDNGQDYAAALFPGMAEPKEGKVTRSAVNDKLNKAEPTGDETTGDPSGMTPAEQAEAEQREREETASGKGKLFDTAPNVGK